MGHFVIDTLILSLTGKCNARCKHCNIWGNSDKSELGIGYIVYLFAHPKLKNIKRLVLTGGEPTLYGNIIDVFRVAFNNLDKLKSIAYVTNSVIPSYDIISQVLDIRHGLGRDNIKLDVSLSLDGIGEIHDNIRGVKGLFSKVKINFNKLSSIYGFGTYDVKYNCVISSFNVDNMSDMIINYAKHAPVVFNLESDIDLLFTDKKAYGKKYIDFFEGLIKSGPMIDGSFYYELIIEQLKGSSRLLPCDFKDKRAIYVNYDGFIYLCQSRKDSLLDKLPYNLNGLNSDNMNRVRERILPYCDGCFNPCVSGNFLKRIKGLIGSKGLYYTLNSLFRTIKLQL